MYLADYHVHSSCSPDGHLTMAEMAREAGVKIIPQCSYARVQFDRKPEYADVYEKE